MQKADSTTPPARALDSREIETFATDGVVCLKQVIPLDLIDQLRDGIDQVFAEFTPQVGNLDLQGAMDAAKAAGVNVVEDQRAASIKQTGRALLSTGVWRKNNVIREFAFNNNDIYCQEHLASMLVCMMNDSD